MKFLCQGGIALYLYVGEVGSAVKCRHKRAMPFRSWCSNGPYGKKGREFQPVLFTSNLATVGANLIGAGFLIRMLHITIFWRNVDCHQELKLADYRKKDLTQTSTTSMHTA
jgi:hypothetical protein